MNRIIIIILTVSHSVALVVATLAIILRTFLELSKLSSKLSSKHNEYQLMMNALLKHIPNQGLILARNKKINLRHERSQFLSMSYTTVYFLFLLSIF